MTSIKRTINGKEYVFELSKEEMDEINNYNIPPVPTGYQDFAGQTQNKAQNEKGEQER